LTQAGLFSILADDENQIFITPVDLVCHRNLKINDPIQGFPSVGGVEKRRAAVTLREVEFQRLLGAAGFYLELFRDNAPKMTGSI
jgi:hypothetical protein